MSGGVGAGRHQAAARGAIEISRIGDRHQASLEDHADPVGQAEDLVELCRDQENGDPVVALTDDLLVHELDAADVDAPRRLRGHEQACAT